MAEEKRWTIYVCPECGETIPEHYAPPMLPGRGHYHDDPAAPFGKRIFHPAEEIPVVPAEQLAEVERERDEAIEGCGRVEAERESAHTLEQEAVSELRQAEQTTRQSLEEGLLGKAGALERRAEAEPDLTARTVLVVKADAIREALSTLNNTEVDDA